MYDKWKLTKNKNNILFNFFFINKYSSFNRNYLLIFNMIVYNNLNAEANEISNLSNLLFDD